MDTVSGKGAKASEEGKDVVKIAICFSRINDPGIATVLDLDLLPLDMAKVILDKMAKSRECKEDWRKELMAEGYYEIGLPLSFCDPDILFKARVKMPCMIDAIVTAYVNEIE